MTRRIELRISGRGGQGILIIGKILATAFGAEGKNLVLTKSYGATARGGASKTDLIVTDREEEVDFPEVLSPNLLVAMTQEAFDANIKDVEPSGVVFVDSRYVDEINTDVSKLIISIPFSGLAYQRLGNEILANILVVLALGKVGIVSNNSLIPAIKKNLPQLESDIINEAIDIAKMFNEIIMKELKGSTLFGEN